MIQSADGDLPWEINPQHSQRAPEILIMPQKKGRKTRKKIGKAITLIIHKQQYFS